MRGTPRGTIHLVRPDTLITGFMLVRERIESSARSLPLPSHRSALRYATPFRTPGRIVFAFSLFAEA